MGKLTISLVIVLLFCLALTTDAFDGNREGFVVGAGVGVGFSASVNPELIVTRDVGYGGNFLIGYAWNNRNMIVYESSGAIFSADTNSFCSGSNWAVQGIEGASWYHYWGNLDHPFFTSAGVGWYMYNVKFVNESTRKFGFVVGAGYEFRKHWQAGLYVSSGRYRSYFDFDLTTVTLLITGVAY